MQTSRDDRVREVVMDAVRALVGIAAKSLADINEDVTLPQYRVMVLVDGRGPQTMGDLSVSLGVTPSTVTRVCDVLVDKDLIVRRPAKDNRRAVCAELTLTGHKLVERVMAKRRNLIDDALGHLSADERRLLAASLARFAEAAGELSDHAWTLGWSIGGEDAGEPGGNPGGRRPTGTSRPKRA